MIVLKTARELELMREAGRISAMALKVAGEHIKPGVSTKDIDTVVHDYIVSEGAVPSFLGYGGFPGSACISVNNEVIHGIPKKTKVIQSGDIVSVDVGACIHGFHGDNAYTFPVGQISPEAQRLLDVTRQSLEIGVKAAVAGNRIGDIGHAVQTYVEENGMAVVKKFVGHGVGENLHESPDVPNYGRAGRGARLVPGMTIAIEPMVNATGENVKVLADGWTTVTPSGSLSAHFEYTIAITENGPVVLTRP